MSSVAPAPFLYQWDEYGQHLVGQEEQPDTAILVADSWLVTGGMARGIDIHRARFAAAIPAHLRETLRLDAFWAAAMAMVPQHGEWFPRVELRRGHDTPVLLFRQRGAPARSRSVVLATHYGADPRTVPSVKGPDLEAMAELRTIAQRRGAGEAVILSPDGFVVEGAYSALVWWRADDLCAPPPELDRVDSVTAKTLLTLACALGVKVRSELALPDDLDGAEVWALSALHGIRVVTGWVDGPNTAEEPGRAELWRRRLYKLSRPLGTLDE